MLEFELKKKDDIDAKRQEDMKMLKSKLEKANQKLAIIEAERGKDHWELAAAFANEKSQRQLGNITNKRRIRDLEKELKEERELFQHQADRMDRQNGGSYLVANENLCQPLPLYGGDELARKWEVLWMEFKNACKAGNNRIEEKEIEYVESVFKHIYRNRFEAEGDDGPKLRRLWTIFAQQGELAVPYKYSL
ncbi:hypothetical protein K491DRAFT_510321 [Lophiostoma macrostomum CBS 122681]|uniref:Uncharacterized protein n=1 Tax=Lophiostoma macrostomum CBS 122681 TaxID=1314788 RepID=A0A6A6T2U2_9PLEO|nr:hypothetical protein K491DRAFT_510321 [Lophiostoma macrostomum CBS 122681]